MIPHYYEKFRENKPALAELLASGRLNYRTTIFEGIEAAPGALISLLSGENIGKYLVRVS